MLTLAEIAALPRAELPRLAAGGTSIDPRELAGHLYRGVSLGLPGWLVRLTWLKFGKAFERDGDTVRGWNVRMVQDRLDQPWQPRLRAGKPITFGHFEAVATPAHVLLDYRRDRSLLAPLRDPLVALDGARLLLGWSYLEIAGVRVPTPSYFALERGGPITAARASRARRRHTA